MVRESRKNAAGPAGGRLPARVPPFGGIRRGVSTNPPRTHQHFFLVLLGWGWFFFFFFLFSVCSADLTFAGKALAAAGTEPGCCAGGRPEGPHRSLRAPGTSPGIAGRSGWKRRDWCKSLEPPRMCSALRQNKYKTLSPCLSFPSPQRRAGGQHKHFRGTRPSR